MESNDEIHQDLPRWARSSGVELNGIEPCAIPGRGTGIVATRDIRAGEKVMRVPENMLYSLGSVSASSISAKLPPDMPLHGLLAADLALRSGTDHHPPPLPSAWLRALPSEEDFGACMPFMWPAALQELLPAAAKSVLKSQQAKFERERDAVVAAAFPDTDDDFLLLLEKKFRYFWFVVNTRSFFHETPEMAARYGCCGLEWVDKLCLVPAADLFNHDSSSSSEGEGGGEGGGCCCAVTWWDGDGYTVTADRDYAAGEELCISYGRHANDFLLVEYGFTVPNNGHDVVGLDDVLLPRLADQALAERDLGGGFRLHPHKGPCKRTREAVALILHLEQTTVEDDEVVGDDDGDEDFEDYDDDDDDDNDDEDYEDMTGKKDDPTFKSFFQDVLLKDLLALADERLERLRRYEQGEGANTITHQSILILVQRWEQIGRIVRTWAAVE
ncbi:hypothetical protein F5Y17DRAFT_411241 [Xylariaceae sp. FL0594]|nr:hypothetical protein F5Y17DRAFT_411241 [Xylariaceae sp. FL0594]